MCMYDNCINILVEALLFSDTLPLLVIRSFLLQSLTSKAPIRAPLLSLIRKISASHLLKAKEVEFPTTTHHITPIHSSQAKTTRTQASTIGTSHPVQVSFPFYIV